MGDPIDSLAVWAVRYALGRRTYVVADVAGTLSRNLDHLTPTTKAIIVRDIDEAAARGDDGLGMACDAQMWRALRARLA